MSRLRKMRSISSQASIRELTAIKVICLSKIYEAMKANWDKYSVETTCDWRYVAHEARQVRATARSRSIIPE